MKGAAIFLLSLAGAAVVGYFVLLPAVRKRDHLRDELANACSRAARTAGALDSASGRLETALAGSLRPEAVERMHELVADFAVGTPAAKGDDEFAFTTQWARVKSLLARLDVISGALASIRIEGSPAPGDCHVRVVLAPVAP